MSPTLLSLLAVFTLVACGGSNDAPGTSTNGSAANNDSANNAPPDNNETDNTPVVANTPRAPNDPIDQNTQNNAWYTSAVERVSNQPQSQTDEGSARNIILFVGDGMNVPTVTAARILAGQRDGLDGEEHILSFGELDYAGLAKTYNVDAQTPDSAGTMTAMMSGVKTLAGVLGVDQDVERGNCGSQTGRELVTALELAELAGKSTGIISTARITHATPAATYAKSVNRGWEDSSEMPAEAIDAGCIDIARQMIEFEARLEARYESIDVDGLEVMMGGGRRHFLPADPRFNNADTQSMIEGRRNDSRNLIETWQTLYPGGQFVMDQSGFDAIDTENTQFVLGLFNESHMQYEADRDNDIAGEPSLSEMTQKAIQVLDNQSNGFFLMVESGRIDHAHHAGSAFGALNETIELAEAVQVAIDNTDQSDTLIVVTADHGHVFTMGGFAKRGNPILGPVVGIGSNQPRFAADGMPFTTLGYANGRGFRNFGDDERNADKSYTLDIAAGRQNLSGVNTESSGFHQEALVPLESETHSGEDVPVYASGPGASLVSGTQEQNVLFHIMNHAGALETSANQRLSQP